MVSFFVIGENEAYNMKRENQSGIKTPLIVLIVILTVVVSLNIILIRKTESERIKADGQMRLSSIAGRVENSLYQSECLLDSLGMKIEQMIIEEGEADRLLMDFFSKETIVDIGEKSDGRCFNCYAAYNGKLYINGFVPDADFVLEERSWYIEAKKRMGAVNVTDPYIDASTGQMCYTISKLLPDGKTVVGLDFNLVDIQQFIEEMSSNNAGTSMIVNGKGMIIGHSDASFVGDQYSSEDMYKELINKVYMLYGDSFEYHDEGSTYSVFSEKTTYDWYLIVCVKRGFGNDEISGLSLYIIVFMILLAIALVVFFIHNYESKSAAEKALSVKEEFLKNMSSELKQPLDRIINTSQMMTETNEEHEQQTTGLEIHESAKELEQMLNNLLYMSVMKSEEKGEAKEQKKNKAISHRRQILLITVVLIITSAFAIVLNTLTQIDWGDTKMQKETGVYYYQVQEWIDNNRAVLDVIADSIAAQPGFANDYDKAVDYLDAIVSKYDNISVAYLCNPEWEHTVLMNNRWEPESNWHVEERQWYIDTVISDNNFSIAAPYLDEQTGLYCTTLSKIVYDAKGNMIGILGIDYYLDKLIGILGASYTDTGYAFLTDIDGNILNHPYEEYQMKPGYSVNAADLCYRSVFYENSITFIDDFDGKRKVCLAMGEETSGFTVIVVKNFEDIYGNAIVSDILYLAVFALCIIIITVIMRNLTLWQERVNSELKAAAEDAISAGKAKNNFLANMSHEIRTPINAVLGMNEMILRESQDNQILEYASNIQSAGRTLLALINEILDFSKIESGKMEIIPVEYDVSRLISDLVNMVKSRADKKGLVLITEIDGSIPSTLYGDDVRLRQIITNILTNAVKYTPKGNIRLKMHLLDISDGVAKLEVSVSDTGMGIKEEDISKLFTSFQRLDQEKNRNIEGTGLGITIVQKLLNMMDSELHVASVYGVGSTFSFVISQKIINMAPLGDYEKKYIANEQKRMAAEVVKTAPEARVLIVDDNDTNLLVAKSLLKRTLVKVETAGSGKECIEKLKNQLFDIVFLDHMMPEMDGIETLREIRDKELAVGTTFVALTANAVSGAKQIYMEAGFDDYLSKPINGTELENCLFQYLDRSLVEKEEKQERTISLDQDNPLSELGTTLDIHKGVANCGDSKETFVAAVFEFCDNSRCNDLELDYSIKDMRGYMINLKKTGEEAEFLGLTELEEKVRLMQEAVQKGDEIYMNSYHRELIGIYRTIVMNMENAVNQYFEKGFYEEGGNV